jgi:hypothetical protein
MTIDMSNNRVPYGLLTDEEAIALHEHEQAGGEFTFKGPTGTLWQKTQNPSWCDAYIYRTVPLPKTQDIIAWERLPDWVEWVARGAHGAVFGYGKEPNLCGAGSSIVRIDDFPGIVVQIGTVDWKDSKQRRPRG